MEGLIWVWAILGVSAFIQVNAISSKVTKLERFLREGADGQGGNLPCTSHESLQTESLQKRIGERVSFEFYEDEEDPDLEFLTPNSGFARIVDADDKWVLVHVEKGKKKIEKMIRISSVKGITQQEQ